MMRARRRRPLSYGRKLVAFCAILPAFAAVFIEAPVPAPTRALVTLLWILCLAPLFQYLGTPAQRRRPLPFVPAISVMYGLYYALPLTLGATDNYYNAPVDPSVDYDYPVQLAFFGWILMMSGYWMGSLIVRDRRATSEFPWRPKFLTTVGLALLTGGLIINLTKAVLGYSIITGGIFQFVVSLQWLGAGLLTILARRGELSAPAKIAMVAAVIATAATMVAGGSIAPLAMFFAVIGFGAWIAKPSVQLRWLVLGVVIGLAATSFRGVASDFRQTVWFGSQNLSQVERLGVMLRLLQLNVENDGYLGTVKHGIEVTAQRSASLDLLANVVRRTPSEVPYWEGQTYLSLIGSFIPRFVWPDKPKKELGQAFGHRYGYIYWSNYSTAINLPILVEFYANFAIIGVIAGMLFTGFIYRVLDAAVNRPGQTPLLSMIGGVLLLPLLLIESDFSLVFGGIPLNAFALWLVWVVMTRGLPAPASARLRPRPGLAGREPLPHLPSPTTGSSRMLGR